MTTRNLVTWLKQASDVTGDMWIHDALREAASVIDEADNLIRSKRPDLPDNLVDAIDACFPTAVDAPELKDPPAPIEFAPGPVRE